MAHNMIPSRMEGVSEEPNGGTSSLVANGGHHPERKQSKWRTATRNARMSFLHSISKMYGTSGSRSLKFPGEQPHVMVGPVIGEVTSTTARILVEINQSGSLTINVREKPPALEKQPSFLQRQLTSGRKGPANIKARMPSHLSEKRVQKDVKANRPSVFEFRALKPGTTYIVEVKGCIVTTASSFRTFPEKPSENITFGVISCNKIFITDMLIAPASDLWTHLSKSIEAGKVDCLLHLGDQVQPLLYTHALNSCK